MWKLLVPALCLLAAARVQAHFQSCAAPTLVKKDQEDTDESGLRHVMDCNDDVGAVSTRVIVGISDDNRFKVSRRIENTGL